MVCAHNNGTGKRSVVATAATADMAAKWCLFVLAIKKTETYECEPHFLLHRPPPDPLFPPLLFPPNPQILLLLHLGLNRCLAKSHLVVVSEDVKYGTFAVVEAGRAEARHDAAATAGHQAAPHVGKAVEEGHLHARRHHRVGLDGVDILGDGLKIR